MTVRVRFAPSPTGYLHIGGARTAIYNYLFAKANDGKFILRVEDTDQDRSKKEFEQSQLSDLSWLGIQHDEGPDCSGEYGPYRQSERISLYQEYAKKLIDSEKAYYCFCSQEELEAKKAKAMEQNLSPHYDGTCRELTKEDVDSRINNGEKPIVRFKTLPKYYKFKDLVRKKVKFPQDMVGDFIIMRSDNYPVYNFCCVVDDMLMKISHVIRAEDHLNNTLRQLMLYEAFECRPPEFAHVSLLIGKDRQKLSKRHGATSVTQYREDSYLPDAINNYLCLLGWSHPEEKDIFNLNDLKSIFDATRFNKAPAVFDFEKFKWVNGMHIRKLDASDILISLKEYLPKDSLLFSQKTEWQEKYINLYKNYVEFYKEIDKFLKNIFEDEIEESEELLEMIKLESTKQVFEYIRDQISQVNEQNLNETDLNNFMNHLKKELKIKGKPLFMGTRVVLTGSAHGPDLKVLATLIPLDKIKSRLDKMNTKYFN
jgi:glutamyl-tRNA synthetase